MEAFGAAVGAEIVGGVAGSIAAVALNAGTPLVLKGSPSARARNAEEHTTAARKFLEQDFKNMDSEALSEARADFNSAKDAREDYKKCTTFFKRLSCSIEFERCGIKAHDTCYVLSSRVREQMLSLAIHEKIGPSESQDPFRDPKDPLPDHRNSLRPSLVKRVLKRMKKKSTRVKSIPLRPFPDVSENKESTERTLGSHEWQEEAAQEHEQPPPAASSPTQLSMTAGSSVSSDIGTANTTLENVDAAISPSA